MNKSDTLIYETWIGRDRLRISIYEGEYNNWKSNILSDNELMSRLSEVFRGDIKLIDLDEGDAGMFPERVFPLTDDIGKKLVDRDELSQRTLAASLTDRILTELGFFWGSKANLR